MRLDLNAYLDMLDRDVTFSLANAVPDGEMLWATFLPERQEDTYEVKDSQLVIYSTMAGMVGRDSPYAPGGVMQASDFREDIVKWSIETALAENQLIKLQELARKIDVGATPITTMVETLLNLMDKIIAQSLRDAMEYARGRAIQDGALNWTFNQKTLSVDYGYPMENILSRLTDQTGSWYLPESTFWDDIEVIRQKLQRQVLAIVMTESTFTKIVNQDANKLQVTEVARTRYSARYTLRRVAQIGYANAIPEDFRSQVEIITYDRMATLFDPLAADFLKHVPFLDDDKVIAFGRPTGMQFEIGSTPLPEYAFGYTHIGPTVEGDGPGRWMRMYTPENQPWRLIAQGVMNGLPVIREPRRIVVINLGDAIEEEGEGEGEGEE